MIAETDLSNIYSVERLDGPIAISDGLPMTQIAKETSPYLFPGMGPSADEARNERVAPHRKAILKVAQARRSQAKARGTQNGNFDRLHFRCLLLPFPEELRYFIK